MSGPPPAKNRPLPPGSELARIHRLPTQKAEDAYLVQRAASGDDRAAEAIWDRFSPLVRSIVRRSLGPDSDARDVVQEVFLQLFRSLGELRDPTALRSFTIGITMRVIGSELRRRRVRRWLRLTDTGNLADIAAEDRNDDAREALRRLYAALDRLDDDERLAFVLRHVEGLELAEVASALRTSLTTTKRRLQKAAARLVTLAEQDPVLGSYVLALRDEPSTSSDAAAEGAP